MKTYLISYDLIRPETSPEYVRLFNMIKSAGIWAKPLASVWLIKSTLPAINIVNQLRTVTDANDKIYVTEVTQDWATFNVAKIVTDWLRQP